MTEPRTQSIAPVGPIAAGVAALVIAAATAVIAPWEGRELVPYRDIAGIWTVCEGITGPAVEIGRDYTHAECDALLQSEVGRHYAGLARCIDAPLQQHEMVALVSWTYNVGIGAACKSTLVRLVNAGQPAEVFCAELSKWVYAGGKRVRGLERRRAHERSICEGTG